MFQFLCVLSFLVFATEVHSWDNGWDGVLNRQCGDTNGFYRVRSQHHNGYEDRRWDWYCGVRAQASFDHCYWSGYVNSWRYLIAYECNPNYILKGVYSYHSNSQEDRRWNYLCCHAPNHFTTNCQISGFTSGYDGSFDYNVGSSKVLTGMYGGYSTFGHKLV